MKFGVELSLCRVYQARFGSTTISRSEDIIKRDARHVVGACPLTSLLNKNYTPYPLCQLLVLEISGDVKSTSSYWSLFPRDMIKSYFLPYTGYQIQRTLPPPVVKP